MILKVYWRDMERFRKIDFNMKSHKYTLKIYIKNIFIVIKYTLKIYIKNRLWVAEIYRCIIGSMFIKFILLYL